MGASIALTGHLNIMAVCLVAGIGLLGSLASFLKRGESGCSGFFLSRPRVPEGRFDSSPPTNTKIRDRTMFIDFFKHIATHSCRPLCVTFAV